MPTERCSLPAFLFLDGLQNPILIAAAIDNAKNNEICFFLIDMEKDVCAAEKKIRIALKIWGIKGILM